MKIYTQEVLLHILKKPIKKIPKTDLYLKNASASEILGIYEWVKHQRLLNVKTIYFEVNDYEKIILALQHYFHCLEAAGGIVEKKNKILWIKRLGKWDFPKGKLEKNEGIKAAAIREVEEECGIKVEILHKVGVTWHTYVVSQKDYLKKTHWYAMRCLDDSEMQPQTDEDIMEVRWFTSKESKIALKNSYETIRKIYHKYDK